MNRIKKALLFSIALCSTVLVFAQSIDDGKKFLYYERHQSAKNVFEKLLAANANNTDAAYWLGQAFIGLEDIASAKAIYQKTLQNNSNSALLLAGMGHIELLEGKTPDARNRFETAVSLSQNKNIDVLNAIGYANASPETKNGDALYAIEKLQIATGLKGMKNPEVYCNLGDAYKKLADGGNAQKSYEKALALDPKYARAYYRIGKVYQTQGTAQEELYMKYYNDAIAADATYGPVYKNLHEIFYSTDVTKSAEYLDKYLANIDDDPKNCYFKASMKYAQGLFADALTACDACINGNPAPYPNLYGLKGYAYVKLNDSANAKAAFELYFTKQLSDKIGSGDYTTYASILLKFPGNDLQAGTYIDKAVAMEPDEANKVTFLKSIAAYYEKSKKFADAAIWYNKIIAVKKSASKTDFYNAGYNLFRTGQYQASIDVFNLYGQKFPEDAFSYYMIGKANWAIDSTMQQGLANSSFEKAIQVGEVDKVKYKNQLIGSYKYFVAYYVNIKKDKVTAIGFCDKVLEVDPADAEAAKNKTSIAAMNFNAPAKSGQAPKANNATGKQEASNKGSGDKATAPSGPGAK